MDGRRTVHGANAKVAARVDGDSGLGSWQVCRKEKGWEGKSNMRRICGRRNIMLKRTRALLAGPLLCSTRLVLVSTCGPCKAGLTPD